MDAIKTGRLIRRLRQENAMTQLQLARQLHISDKTVSKWERGLGCPDVSLLEALSRLFGVDTERLLEGELGENARSGGNMKKLRFHVCPQCGNLLVSMPGTAASCCGKKLPPLLPRKAQGADRLDVEILENTYYISSGHPMQREHFISFVALLTGDTLLLRKQYPEWDLQVRLPQFAHGQLLWYCTRHGLFWQEV